MPTTRDTLKHADILLATVRPSSKDLEPQDLIAKAAKQERTLYIVNCAGKTAAELRKDASKEIASHGKP